MWLPDVFGHLEMSANEGPFVEAQIQIDVVDDSPLALQKTCSFRAQKHHGTGSAFE